MSPIVERTCSVIQQLNSTDVHKLAVMPLECLRNLQSYVLLGPPGIGKTTSFQAEAEAERGIYLSARDFLTLNEWPKWKGKVLFIDGLDEVRVGEMNKRAPFDNIRKNLARLGKPRFRLSCREAEWMGPNDERHLQKISMDGHVTVVRLDPLTLEDARLLLSGDHNVKDPDKFINHAKSVGIDGLLSNPQTLQLLAKAVGSGPAWPQSKTEVFEKACTVLVEEHNEEHAIFQQIVPQSDLLEVAGEICAIVLLTGNYGCSLKAPQVEGVIQGSEVFEANGEANTRVFGTKLFEKTTNSAFTPIHVHVAEFLAGKHLASLVDNGLAIGRILSLMTYNDGVVVSHLRGVAAWLAALSPTSRPEIMCRDPVGTVLYGDVRNFSLVEKQQLVEGIRRCLSEDRQLLPKLVDDSRVGELFSENALHVFNEAFAKLSSHDQQSQHFVRFLVSALKHETVHAGLDETLWTIVRDAAWHDGTRVEVLEVLFSNSISNLDNGKFKELISDIQASAVEDFEDELKGALLEHLYGTSMSLREIIDFLDEPKAPSLIGRYQVFWLNLELDGADTEQIETSLDRIVHRMESYRILNSRLAMSAALHGKVFLRMLAALVRRTAAQNTEKLIDWLGFAFREQFQDVQGTRMLVRAIEQNLEAQKAIISKHVQVSLDARDFDKQMKQINDVLFRVDFQSLLGNWLLDEALVAPDERVAIWLIEETAGAVHSAPKSNGSRKADVKNSLSGHYTLSYAFEKRLMELENSDKQWRQDHEEHFRSKQQRQEKWRKLIENEETALQQNRAPSGFLDQLARVYFGEVYDIEGDSPNERLRDLIGDNSRIVNVVLDALRNAIGRDDVPDQASVLDLRRNNRIHNLSLPILAGLQENSATGDFTCVEGNEQRIRTALAIYYSVRLLDTSEHPPQWLVRLAESSPEIYAEVLVDAVRFRWEDVDECRAITRELATAVEYAEVARIAIVPLLNSFPVRCSNRQLDALAYLLRAATTLDASIELDDLVRKKLTRKSMDIGQRVYWLGVGLLLNSDEYFRPIESYLGSSDKRVGHFVGFLSEQVASKTWIESFAPQIMRSLIRLIATRYRPLNIVLDLNFSAESSQASRCVSSLIDQLSQDPSELAMQCINELRHDQDLVAWHGRFNDASNRQQQIRRECSFKYRSVKSVIGTLKNEKPSNVADLKAAVLGALDRVRGALRDGDTSGWRKYWNVDSYNRARDPKPENGCRDILVDDLRPFLRSMQISIYPEVAYSNDKKCDLTTISGDFKLPLEVKLSHSRDLWTAIEDQLVPRYTRDPESEGHGVFIVFWFGEKESIQPTPLSGTRPSSAIDLEQRLEATLSVVSGTKISVSVLDVSSDY